MEWINVWKTIKGEKEVVCKPPQGSLCLVDFGEEEFMEVVYFNPFTAKEGAELSSRFHIAVYQDDHFHLEMTSYNCPVNADRLLVAVEESVRFLILQKRARAKGRANGVLGNPV